jgi:muramoyltetrapeptide carboxypeptidase
MFELIKPRMLRPGDTIGLVSPSSPVAGLLPHRVEKGIAELQRLGFKVVVGKNALKVTGHTAGTPEERAADLNTFFADPTIDAIVTFIGGFHANQILPFLDYGIIRKNPKVFMGFSDISVLHLAIQAKAGLVTFYGPAVLTQFAENPHLDQYTEQMFRRSVMSVDPIGIVKPSLEWTEELLNWFAKADLERPRVRKINSGWEWLRHGQASGQLLGGCITSILHNRGTEYWPDFSGKIFFWELADRVGDMTKGEPVSRIDAHLTDLELSGVFKGMKGMIVGRPIGYSDEELVSLKKIILQRTEKYQVPILFGIDIGHTEPIMTLPIGAHAAIDSINNTFSILEPGVNP